MTLIGALVATVLAFAVAPFQQVRQQSALDDEQAAADAAAPSLIVKDARYADEVRSAATSRVLELSQFTQDFADPNIQPDKNLLPPGEDIQPGPLELYLKTYTAQPRIYDSILVTLVGNHYKPVNVKDVSINIVKQAEPPSGTLVFAGPQGGGPSETIGFDLDSSDHQARIDRADTDTPQPTTEHYFNVRQITLNRFESVSLRLVVFESKYLYQLTFSITTDDGHVYVIDDHGAPWRVSAFAPSYQRTYAATDSIPPIARCEWPNECLSKYI